MIKDIRICRNCGVVFDCNAGKTKIAQYVTMGNTSHSDTIRSAMVDKLKELANSDIEEIQKIA